MVYKFGGSSLADKEGIFRCAQIVKKEYGKSRLAVVVSAMGNMTDDLIGTAKEISPDHDKRELDLLLSTAEVQSACLFSMALNELGVKAKALDSRLAGIKAQGEHGGAEITEINTENIMRLFDDGFVAVVTGFQAVGDDGEIYTLGRGGSDTSAVALASALNAEKCVFYKDVDGIYTADPKKDKSAVKLDKISFSEMKKLIDKGSGVLHKKAVEIAEKNSVSLEVRSSFTDNKGTVLE